MSSIQAIVAAARDCIDRGWQLVPVDGKKPLGNDWQHHNYALDDIADTLSTAKQPGVGVKLGPESGIIDIEADSPKEETAFVELFAGCDVPITATFASSRGKHRLFAWEDRLANCLKAVVDYHGLGIRIGACGKGAQSVFPPSPGRKWLVSPDDSGVAKLPDIVIERIIAAANGVKVVSRSSAGPQTLLQRAQAYVAKAKPAGEGERNNAAFKLAGHVAALEENGQRLSEHEILAVLMPWNLGNSPPLSTNELQTCIRSSITNGTPPQAKLANAADATATPPGGASLRDMLIATIANPNLIEWADLTAIQWKGDPTGWSLRHPKFVGKTENGWLRFDSTHEFGSKAKVTAACREVQTPMPGRVLKVWQEVCDLLCEYAEVREVDLDERRDVLIARAVLRSLERAKLSSVNEPDASGKPTRLPSDGGVCFTIEKLVEDIDERNSRLRVESREVVRCCKELANAKRKNYRIGKTVLTRKFIGTQGESRLRAFVGEAVDGGSL